MSLLEIKELSHTFGENQIFHDANVSLHKGEHIGIVGQNGAGKSTFIKICTKQLLPDHGSVIWQPGVVIGYLDQYASIKQEETMEEFLRSAFQSLYQIEKKLNDLYAKAADGEEKALIQAEKYQEKLELHDFYQIDTMIDKVATGLGLTAIGLDRPIQKMSGGQRAKVILAKLLLQKPDVLLLDEPTNFLDKEHIAWLADYLSSMENAYMVVSHDEQFLNQITTRICDIDNKKIRKYSGSYEEFQKKKVLLREDYIRQYTVQQRKIKKTEAFIQKNIAGRKSKMARGRQKQLDHMERMEQLDLKELRPEFFFPLQPLTKAKQLQVTELSVGYDSPILSNLNFVIHGGEKVVITGFNGIGKSTLLKTLLKQIPALQGKFGFSKQAKVGYFEQDLVWEDDSLTPIEVVADRYPKYTTIEIRQYLVRCGIPSKHAMQEIGSLSGGEQAKVKMCLLTMKKTNFLILDEPTNHMDVQAKEALVDALKVYPGTVVVVSHEEAFYQAFAERILSIEQMKQVYYNNR